ncbi:hypothetical protein OS493_035244 [Desmophyllum pertusum]|uniref:Uncharacterized protein n=1 Tax=Desmophyllum pertusum TaxID=174260 RepID=A0A9W9ZKJ4_9CNID|nr:hypothetical protein OS493_035244 [Desmophyllum pertusum]
MINNSFIKGVIGERGNASVLRAIWDRDVKDRKEFWTDQSKNRNGKYGNRWSTITYRMALAVSAEALLPMKLWLAHYQGDGPNWDNLNESAGDYSKFKEEKMNNGLPEPIGWGVLIGDEVANFQFPENKEVNITSDESVVSSRGSTDIQRCDHEEADTRIAVHVQHTMNKGCSQVFVHTVDTDVLVIMIGLFHDMIALYPSAAIWIGLGMGKYVQYISVNATCAFRGPETSRALPIFSFIYWIHSTQPPVSLARVRSPFPDMTEAFKFLQDHPYY